MELVSAIITTHNRKDMLKRAIDSVLAQTYPNIELIVVSDASTDGTDEMCSALNDLKYISIPKEKSRGGNYARNLGIKAAKGEYVAFLDDDDAWLPTKIDKQVQLIEEKKCECVYCLRLMERIKDGNLLNQSMEGLTYKYEGDLSKKIFRHSITSTSCILSTKKVLDQIGGFDESIPKMQEFELLVRLSQVTEIYYWHDEALVKYTIDVSDKNRISNDPKRLPIAKNLIKSKHALLLKKAGWINRLCFEDRMLVAQYKFLRKDVNSSIISKYAIYYYFTLPIRFIYERL